MKLDKKGKMIMSIYCYGVKHMDKGIWNKINFFIYKILNSIILIGMFNTEMRASKTVSTDLVLYHPYGIVINSNAVVKKGCIIRQQVTIGNKGENDQRCPKIGENVEIGAGAKIIGPIEIGAGSIIGANAVVTKSFPKNSVLIGVPAKNIANNI